MAKQYAFRIFTFVCALAVVILLFVAQFVYPTLMLLTIFPMLNIVIAVSVYGVKPFRIILAAVLIAEASLSLASGARLTEGIEWAYPLAALHPLLGIAAEFFCIFKPFPANRDPLACAEDMGKCWIEIGLALLIPIVGFWSFELFSFWLYVPGGIVIAVAVLLSIVRNIFLAKKLHKEAVRMRAQQNGGAE